MRVLDWGTAAVIGLIAVGFIYTQNPYAAQHTQAVADADLRASLAIAHYLKSDTPSCQSILAASNSTVVFGGIVGGIACAEPPKAFLGFAEFMVPGTRTVVEAWVV